MGSASLSYKGHRYLVEVVSRCVWLYFRFPLSFREVEELLLERGAPSPVRRCAAGVPSSGSGTQVRCAVGSLGLGTQWHLDEVFIKINGEQKYLWRAVGQAGNVLDILVRDRRDKAAAGRFLRRLLKKTRTAPRVIVTDRLRSYSAAHREVMPCVEHRQSKYLSNRAENSHQPTRQRERAMKGFRSVGAAQRFLSALNGISPHFRPRRHLMTAAAHRAEVSIRFATGTRSPAPPTGPPRPDHRPGSQAHPAPTHRQAVHTQQRNNASGRVSWRSGTVRQCRDGVATLPSTQG